MTTHELDHIDRSLIGALRKNARLSVSALAKALQVSRATVQNRMERLERRGIITGYTALVSSSTQESISLVRALMHIELEGNVSKKVRETLTNEPSVSAIHTTNGRWDFVVELQSPSLEALDRVLARVRTVEGVAATETSILLTSQRISSSSI
ncbi:MAG: Lrp/AsnC family transcriptional regulator [Saccharospirillum sp.]|nr:Lrp/AsnC family transcriptional regulator [Saccharospirillum sp.]